MLSLPLKQAFLSAQPDILINPITSDGHRHWRRRKGPLEPVWRTIVVPMLEADEGITVIGIFGHLCEYHTDKFSLGSRRTLEHRILKRYCLQGPNKNVVFLQTHKYGHNHFRDRLDICHFLI